MNLKRVCVYCGSNSGADPAYAEAARHLGTEIARRGLGLVYGGGRVGLMGVIANSVLEAKGEVIGIIPEALVKMEVAHHGLTDLRIVHSMHERKALMVDLSDAFIAMPGGYGTLDEFCEVLTWAQLGMHQKPHGLLNVLGYYDSLLAFFDHSVTAGFIRLAHRQLIHTATEPAALLDLLAKARAPQINKWLDRDQV